MAQKVQVLLLCDLEDGGKEALETVRFGVGNISYEIDVCAAHAQDIRANLEPFVTHARRVSASASNQPRRERSGSSREQSAAIRSWAKDHGIEVSERGRIPASVVREYEQNH